MLTLLTKKWTPQFKTQVLMDIICQRKTVQDTSQLYDLPLKQIRTWMAAFSGGYKLNELKTKFIVLKDSNSVYQDYNLHAATLGAKTLIQDCINKTDYAVNPALAEQYIAYDQMAIKEKKPITVADTVVHSDFGSMIMECVINPIFDDNGEPRFILLTSCPKFSVSTLNFTTVQKILHRGCAHLLVKGQSVTLQTKYGDVKLTPRESEYALYLMAGKTIKDIANLINLSPKTAEHSIIAMQNKLGVSSKSHLLTNLMNANFLNLL